MEHLENYYNNYDEERRLLSKHGNVEYITTQKYIHDCIQDMQHSRKMISLLLCAAMVLPLVCCAPKTVSQIQDPTSAFSALPSAIVVVTEIPSVSPGSPVPAPSGTPSPTPSPAVTEVPATPAPRTPEEITRDLLIYYGLYGEGSEAKRDLLFRELEQSDPDSAWRWSAILDFWDSLHEDSALDNKVLPDGLSDSDSLCIVVLGYQLNADGSMKNELKERLKVALKCAKKYPKAYVLCTGGGTASKKKSATEAGKMAEWLRKNGVSKKRIIVEDQSLSTVQNAKLSIRMLREQYPQVQELAIVTSGYHLPTGMLFFETAAVLAAEDSDEPRLHVVSCARCSVSGNTRSAMYHAGSLIGMSGDSETARLILDNDYDLSAYTLPDS